ncbi:MAG TPA: 3-oxoacyl-[acyl-carrier-protein] reductase [Chloroflexi bacterium]|jgi:3-oxoacyl-[acyl-carrier protein] reductase|nr:3-oxoacyl-[acyl-carrier-protein] reductase [Chloroflexota bacterium]
MGHLSDKVALVTGGSRGIGRAIAIRLATEGADVAVNYRTDEVSARAAVEAIEATGRRGFAVQGDVSVAEDAQRMVTETIASLGAIHILVNNAGVSADMLTMRLSEADWDRVLDTDLKGAFLTTKAAMRPMLRQHWGRIINISSVVGYTGNAGQASYASAKAGLMGFTKSVAREVATRSITANVVAPGLIDTDMTERLSEEIRNWMLAQVPMGKSGTPEDVAAAVAFLASDDAAYMTGQTIKVDGGMVMV